MTKIRYLFLFWLLLPLVVNGQSPYTSARGWFTVYEKKGCAKFTLQIKDTGSDTGNPMAMGISPCTSAACAMFWGDGTSPSVTYPSNFTHDYTKPDTLFLRVLFSIDGYDSIQIIITPNIQPEFEIYTCSDQKVQVNVTDTNYDSYLIYYGDGSPEVPAESFVPDTHDYKLTLLQPPPDPSPQLISVRGKDDNAEDNCKPPAIKPVDVISGNLVTPFIDLLTVTSSSQVDLEFNNLVNVLYKPEIALNSSANGNFQPMSISFLNTSTGSIPSLQTDVNYYCFRLSAFDPCDNTLTLPSNIICSAKFNPTAQINFNNVAWNTSTTNASFDVYRDGVFLTNTNSLSYPDGNVECTVEYWYQIFTNYTNGSQSISLEKPVTAKSGEPTAIENISTIVGTNSVDLNWLQDPGFVTTSYNIFRNASGGVYSLEGTSPTTQYTDVEYSTKGEYCYQITYTDECGLNSETGREACPIRLNGKLNTTNITPPITYNSITLIWNKYNGWVGGVNNYTIEKYDEAGNLLDTFSTSDTTLTDSNIDPDMQVFKYIVIANAVTAGLPQSVSNEIVIAKKTVLIFPDAFTPNDDGLNDSYKPKVPENFKFVTGFEMKIFNRWGQLLFTTNDYKKGWDGRLNGNIQPEGTYAFTCRVTDQAGQTFDRSGSFVLLKKK